MKQAQITTVAIGLMIVFQTLGQEQNSFDYYDDEIHRILDILDNEEVIDSLANRVFINSGLIHAFDEEMGMYEEEELQKSRNWFSSFRMGVSVFSANTYTGPDNESITSVGVLPNIGLSITVDPEKLVNRKSLMRMANHKRQRSYHLQADHKQRLKTEILNHYFQYLTMLECLVLKQKTLHTREQRLNVIEIAFKNGNATYDEVMVVQNQYDLWNEELTKSRIEALRKKKEIEILIGKRS